MVGELAGRAVSGISRTSPMSAKGRPRSDMLRKAGQTHATFKKLERESDINQRLNFRVKNESATRVENYA